MRVLIINTTERQGGPAIAAYRLTEALKDNGIRAKMLVRTKETDRVTTIEAETSMLTRNSVRREQLRLAFHNRLAHSHRYPLHLGTSGEDITRLPEFRQADVIHLHWINDGMLSLDLLQRILDSGKPVVWTMHDMWPFTGICHYAHECENYRNHCHTCPQLNSSHTKDLSFHTFDKKANLLHGSRIQFVACSHWLEELAQRSALLHDFPIACIPNAVDTKVFHPMNRRQCREALSLPTDRRLLLFSSQYISDRRKGFDYLVEALHHLLNLHPEWSEQMALVVAGGDVEKAIPNEMPLPVYRLPYISDENRMAQVCNAVDIFTIPSLQDNLPNTVVEAMACAVPCIGFEVGGIPEMIDHLHNGYIAPLKDTRQFAEGIHWLLTEGDYDMLSREALRKAQTTYSETSVATAHIAIYNRITGKNE